MSKRKSRKKKTGSAIRFVVVPPRRATALPVRTLKSGEPLLPDRVYLVPQGRELVIRDGVAHLSSAGAALPHGPDPARTAPLLTPRELEVLKLLVDGLANKEVARALGISVRTAETHREHLLHKLNILTMAGLTKYAIQQGLTSF